MQHQRWLNPFVLVFSGNKCRLLQAYPQSYISEETRSRRLKKKTLLLNFCILAQVWIHDWKICFISLKRRSSSIKTGAFRHLSPLLKVAGTCYKTKVQKPLQEIYHTLQSVDLHPLSLILALKEKVYNSSTRCLLSARLLLGHVPATETNPQRPAIVLSPGELYFWFFFMFEC